MSSGDTGPRKLTFAEIAKAAEKANPSPKPKLPPVPTAVPVATPKPAPTTAGTGKTTCALQEEEKKKKEETPKERGYPLGFKDKAQFEQCMQELKDALEKEGIAVSAVGVRGSSVTVISNNPNKRGKRFDGGKKASDIDAFFVPKGFLKCSPSGGGQFRDDDVAEEYPAISDWNQKWSEILNRPVAAAGWKSKVRKGSHKPTAADSIVQIGAL